MQCPNCQRENASDRHFCIFCGSLLPAPETEAPPESMPGPVGTPPKQLQALQEEVRRLSTLVALMNTRLAALEHMQAIPTPSPESTPTPTAPNREVVPIPAVRVPPRKGNPTKVKKREWEQVLGSNWLARVGVLALVIGTAFFLTFAFDNNWIGPTGRVILGIVAGLAMLGGGHYWQKRYPILAQAISGGGTAVLYLSTFAAFAFYDLIHFYVAFAFLLLVNIASVVLAIRYNSMALAIIGILGAFIAPFMLGTNGPVGGEASSVSQILAYVIVVDLSVLALSTSRNWRWLTLLALFSSLVVFGVLYGEFGHMDNLLTFQISLTLIFLTFVGATTMFHIIWRRAPQHFDQVLMVINAAAYFSISLGLLWDGFRIWMGCFVLLLALFYGGVAYAALRRSLANSKLSFFALGIALVFLTVAMPIQLGDKVWTTVAWAAEGTALIWLSFILRMPQLRGFSYTVFAIMAVRLLFFDTTVDVRTSTPILNERFMAFLVSIAALYLTGYLLRRKRAPLRDWEKRAWSVYPISFAAANFFTLWILSAETIKSFDTPLALTVLWAIYAVALLVVGMIKQWRPVRLASLALLAITIIKVFAYDVFTLTQLYRIIAFIGLGSLLLASAYLYQRYSKSIRGFIAKK